MKRFTETDKWRDSWFQALSPEHKLALIYIYDNCDAAGVFDPNFGLADFCIGQKTDWKSLSEVLGDRVQILESGKWFLTKFIGYQYGKLSPDCKPHAAVIRLIESHGISTVSKGYSNTIHTNKEKEKEKEQDKETEKDKDTTLPDLGGRIGKWFGRRQATQWSEKEMKALKSIISLQTPEPDIAVLEEFYMALIPKKDDYRRRDILTLLNNWNGEIDRAKKYTTPVTYRAEGNF